MEIGPISAIRPVPMIRPESAPTNLSRVFKAEYRAQRSDDEYSPANGQAARGLEVEEDEAGDESAEAESLPEVILPRSKVSFFA